MLCLKRLAVILFLVCLSFHALASGEVDVAEVRWENVETNLDELITALAGQKTLIYNHLVKERDVFWPTGISYSVTAKSILARPYCRSPCSPFTCCFYSCFCFPRSLLRVLSCGRAAEVPGISGIKERVGFSYDSIIEAEKAVQWYHFEKYSSKKRNLIIKAGNVSDLVATGRSENMSAGGGILTASDSGEDIILFYRKYNREGCAINDYKVYADQHMQTDACTVDELKKKFDGRPYIRLFHSPYAKSWGSGYVKNKPSEGDNRVKKVSLEYLELSGDHGLLGDYDISLLVNYFDARDKSLRSDCVHVPFANEKGDNYGYCNLFDIQPKDAKAVVTVISKNSTMAINVLIFIADYIADPLMKMLEDKALFTVKSVAERIRNFVFKPKEGETEERKSLLGQVTEWVKEKTRDEIIGVFSVEFDKLETLGKHSDSELRTLRTSDSSEVLLGLWYKP